VTDASEVIDVDAVLDAVARQMSPALPAPTLPAPTLPAPMPRGGDMTSPAIATAPPKSYIEAGIQVDLPGKLYVEMAIQVQEIVPIQASAESDMAPAMPDVIEHVDMPGDSEMAPAMPVTVNAIPISSLPFALPPSVTQAPTSSSIPSVNLLPPTPSTSQEVTTSGATALLEVPDPSFSTRSPVAETRSPVAEVRRSPRLTSPAPPNKRPASESLDVRASKKSKEQ